MKRVAHRPLTAETYRSRRGGRRAMPLLVLVAGCGSPASPPDAGPYLEPREPCAERDPLRKAYFGDLHAHTALSFDAWTYDVRNGPKEAYDFARGGTVYLPPLDANGRPTLPAHLDRPLDFAAVTDHSEYLGETSLCTTPGSPAYDSTICKQYRPPTASLTALGIGGPNPIRPAICGDDGKLCLDAAAPVWRSIKDAAEAAYDRTAACRFTSFVAYEYTLSPLGSNLHRNVIFRSARSLPQPITFFEAPQPIDLWTQLRAGCQNAGTGCDVLAIPHNANISNGRMFVPDYPDATGLDDERRIAMLRRDMEPLVEIAQHKGDSECVNGLPSAPGAPDELCDFEKTHNVPINECAPGKTGFGGFLGTGCLSPLDFVRHALKAGLQEQARLGVNPYRLGIIGSTDTHNGTPGAVAEQGFQGHLGTADNTPKAVLTGQTLAARPLVSNPGGLAGVWAEENSRDAIFDALRRREAFGTSGPRIALRLFGGWSYPDGLCADPELVKRGYAGGVPMGGELPARPGGAGAPKFIVAVLRDPGVPGKPGTQLQRVQIIKGWIDAAGAPRERVFEVDGDAKGGATVDTATCVTKGPGHDSLCAVWTDPEFDPALRAFYYARAAENPTCRWSTWLCNGLTQPEQKQYKCDALGVPKAIQERAWSSPIWYAP
ncbi:MAG: DUF3604 domain-containing protein [Myxococcales bacterium]|nr:DUF3604 domain-containing protein [Myxococcales bacterium]